MAKKPEAKKPEAKNEAVTTEVATVEPAALPAKLQASAALMERISEVKENLESVESFRIPRIKMTSEGIEVREGEEPVKEVEGVILHTRMSNVYYKDNFNPDNVTPPTCFSQDGKRPDPSVKQPVHATCKGCPMAEFGTNNMKSGKACRNLKPVYLLVGDAIMPRQLTVTPASLKAANLYFLELAERGVAYRKVITKITAYKKDRGDTYFTLKFTKGENLPAEKLADVDYLKAQWLPIMDSQVLDQREVDSTGARPVQEASGDY